MRAFDVLSPRSRSREQLTLAGEERVLASMLEPRSAPDSLRAHRRRRRVIAHNHTCAAVRCKRALRARRLLRCDVRRRRRRDRISLRTTIRGSVGGQLVRQRAHLSRLRSRHRAHLRRAARRRHARSPRACVRYRALDDVVGVTKAGRIDDCQRDAAISTCRSTGVSVVAGDRGDDRRFFADEPIEEARPSRRWARRRHDRQAFTQRDAARGRAPDALSRCRMDANRRHVAFAEQIRFPLRGIRASFMSSRRSMSVIARCRHLAENSPLGAPPPSPP